MINPKKSFKKRIFIGILAGFIGLSSISMISHFYSIQATAADQNVVTPKYDSDDTDSDTAFNVMRDFGLITADSNGIFNPQNSVSRGEVAVFLARLLGVKNSSKLTLFAKTFSDVPYNNGYYNSVTQLANTKINGVSIIDTSKSEFNPNDNITQEDFLKMLLVILDYGNQSSYTDTAKNLGINIGNTTDHITQSDMAYSIYSALDMKISGSDQTILSKYLGLVKFTGVVSNNPINDANLQANEIRVGIRNTFNGNFKNSEALITFKDQKLKLGAQYIGQPILGFAKVDGSEIVTSRSLSTPVIIKSSEISKDKNNNIDLTSNKNITYTSSSDSSSHTLNLSDNLTIIYNSKIMGSKSLSEIQQILNNQNSDCPFVQGQINLFAIDQGATMFDAISIENCQTMVVDTVNKYTMQIMGKTVGNSIDILSYSVPDTSSDAINGSVGDPYLVTYLFDRVGNPLSEELILQIQEWDILSIKNIKGANGKEYNYCNVSPGNYIQSGNTITGTIKSIKNNTVTLRVDIDNPIYDSISRVTTQDKTYGLSANLRGLSDTELARAGIQVGLESQELCLDSFGMIAATKKTYVTDEQVSYVANAGIAGITVLDKNGKLHTYGVNPIILVNEQEISYPLFSIQIRKGDVIGYELNDKGVIYKINIPRTDMKGQTSNVEQFAYNLQPAKSATYHSSTGALTFENNEYDTVYTTKDTKFFIVPSDPQLSGDINSFDVLDQQFITDGQVLNNVKVFSVDNDRFAKLVLIYDIDKQVIDQDYNSLGMFNQLANGNTKANITKDGFYYTDGVPRNLKLVGISKITDLVKGAVIFPEYNSEDGLRKITGITSLSNGKFVLNQGGLNSYLNARSKTRVYFGEVTDRKNAMLTLSDNISNKKVTLAIPSNASVSIYDFTRPENDRRYESSIQMIDLKRQNLKYEILAREFDSKIIEVMVYIYQK